MLETIAKELVTLARLLLLSVIWSALLFNLGRVFLLLVTVGRFPRGRDLDRHPDAISSAGVLVLLLAWLLIALYNNMGATPL